MAGRALRVRPAIVASDNLQLFVSGDTPAVLAIGTRRPVDLEAHGYVPTRKDGAPPLHADPTSAGPQAYQRLCFIGLQAFPLKFRGDVVAVARKSEASIASVAKDFGVSESGSQRCLRMADVDDRVRPGTTSSEAAELRELKRRNRLLKQENDILRRAAFLAREISPR